MNADAFRHLYNYHFDENRKIWDSYITSLPYKLFTQNVGYSHGSIRNQIVHLMNVEELWFSELQNIELSDQHTPTDFDDRELIRSHWDQVELSIRTYLSRLEDTMLFEKPILFEEDRDLIQWQVLIHVINHGTDHRAQILRSLNDFGVETGPQDYIFYAYDNKVKV